MADKTIGELPVASELYDDSLLVVEQQKEARSIKGELIGKFAREAADADVQRAVDAANAAEKSKQDAAGSADEAEAALGKLSDEVARATAQADNAAKSATAAAGSASSAAASETKAAASQTAAAGSASAAKASENNAKSSADAAKASQTAAKTSEGNANASATAADASKSAAAASAAAAKASETAAGESETAAEASASEAAASASGASMSASEAKKSQDAAKASETAAKNSQTAAAGSATAAGTSASNASASASNAAKSAAAAKTSQDAAKASETAAGASATAAKTSETASGASATAAKNSETAAKASQNAAENFAVGETDSAKYYYDQAKRIAQGLEGALIPMGTIAFSNLATASKSVGYMYNISDAFTTNATFKEGSGHAYPAGTNVYYTGDGYWDCLAGYQVVSVNGQTGAVTLNASDVGALPITGGEVTGSVAFDKYLKIKAWTGYGTGTANLWYDGNTKTIEAEGANNISLKASTAGTADKVGHALTFTGGSSVTFDGSTNQSVPIPTLSSLGAVPTSRKVNNKALSADISLTASDVGALPITGGTLTGDLTLSGTTRTINYNSGTRTGQAIRFYAGGADGSGLVIGEGGRTIIGGGESAANLHEALGTGTAKECSEEMHIGSDGPVFIHTNCQAIENRKTVTIDTNGKITAPGGFSGALSGNATSATKLATARTINGTAFDGSKNITLPKPTVYQARGRLLNSSDVAGAEGYGQATVLVYPTGFVEVHFSLKITKTGTRSNYFFWGVNRDCLRNCNSSIPVITPVEGGRIVIDRPDGTRDDGGNGFGALCTPNGQFWVPARMYAYSNAVSGAIGQWPENQFPYDTFITGTLYGTVSA